MLEAEAMLSSSNSGVPAEMTVEHSSRNELTVVKNVRD